MTSMPVSGPGDTGRKVVRVRPSPPTPTVSRARTYERVAQPAPMRLEQRDIQVLEAVAWHRFLSGDQLRRLFFPGDPSTARRRLRALFDHHLLNRLPILAQPSRGIPPFVYALTATGRLALTAELGRPPAPERGSRGRRYLRHRFLVNNFYVALQEATQGTPYTVSEWRHEEELLLPRGTGLDRPEQVAVAGEPKPLPLLPDAYFQLQLGGAQSLAFFLEMDLATHPLRVWRERARLYVTYAGGTPSLFRRRFGRETFRLLIVTPPDYRGRSRRDNILTTIEQTVGKSDLFLAATLPEVTADRLLGRVWRPATGQAQPGSFLPHAGVRVGEPPRPAAVTIKRSGGS